MLAIGRAGTCRTCRTRICAPCKRIWHTGTAWTSDEQNAENEVLAGEMGWTSCYVCGIGALWADRRRICDCELFGAQLVVEIGIDGNDLTSGGWL